MACKKAALTTMDAPNDDAAILIGESLATNNYGVSSITQDISTSAKTLAGNANCGVTISDSIIRKSTVGVPFKHDYKLNYTHKLNCKANLPDNITGLLVYKGSFVGPKIISDNSGNRTYMITGLEPTSDNYVFNGVFKIYNNYKLKLDTNKRGSASIYLGIKDLAVSKTNHTIISGKAMVMITGSSSKKANFTYNGEVIFNNSTSATLILNGDQYSIDIITGNVVKK